jgi:hypothetical protein
MIEFVLFVSLVGDLGFEEKFAGTFENCKVAEIYYDSNYRNKKEYNGYRCIRKDLITKKDELKFLGKGHD